MPTYQHLGKTVTCLLYMGIDIEGHKLLPPVYLVAEAKRRQLKYLASQIVIRLIYGILEYICNFNTRVNIENKFTYHYY